MTDYCPTKSVPKSKLVVCTPLSSTINLANSTAVACTSIVSLTNIESDFKLITPLKSPAYVGLYFTVIFDCYIGDIFNILGSTDNRAP